MRSGTGMAASRNRSGDKRLAARAEVREGRTGTADG
jgi:hypothetical protein